MKRKWQGALGIVLSAIGLWWAFRGVPWQDFATRVRGANVGLLLLCAVAATAIFPVRAIRWRVILDPIAPGLPFGPLWRSIAIGMMATNVFPGRLGELARPLALSRERRDVPFPAGLASVVVDRLFDFTSVLLLMAVAMLDPRFLGVTDIAGHSLREVAILSIILMMGAFVVLYLLASFPRRMIALYEGFARRVAPAIEARGAAVLSSFAGGLSVLRSPVRFLKVLVWAVLHWLLNAFAFWLAFRALHIDAPFAAALFAQGVITAFVSIPAAPGFAGLFELGGRVGLAAFGVAGGAAATWALTFHAVSYVPITILGLWYLSRAGLTVGEIRAAGEQQTAPDSPS